MRAAQLGQQLGRAVAALQLLGHIALANSRMMRSRSFSRGSSGMTASCFADTAVDGSLATQDCLKPPRIRARQAYLFRRAP